MDNPVRFFIVCLLCWSACCAPAWAYVDGGSAHLLIQGLIAAVAGVIYFIRNPRELWAAIKRRFKRDRS